MNFVLSKERCKGCQVPDNFEFPWQDCHRQYQREMNDYVIENAEGDEGVRQAWLSNVNSVGRGKPVPCTLFQDATETRGLRKAGLLG